MSVSTWNTVAHAAITVCWAAFAVVWVVGAVHNARHAPAVRRRSLRNVQWILIAVAAFAGLRLISGGDWARLTTHTTWTRLPGLVLLVVATAFTIWARFSLGEMWSSDVALREGHQLRTEGPYGIVRHPIYTGLIGMLLGSALLDGFGLWLLALAAGGVVLVIKLRAEERLMDETFPGEYERYRRRVPALVPLPWRRELGRNGRALE
jgi:protein-S-isoprenylcysteine O-methyltransferase Ste14